MKTLVKNNISLMMLEDNTPLKMGEFVEIGEPVKIKINNTDGSIILYENVVPPENYSGKRFCFDGVNWSYNYEWRNAKLTAAKR